MLPQSAFKVDPHKQVYHKNVMFSDTAILVAVKGSKTIKYGERELCVPVCNVPGSKLCPVSAYKKLITMVPTPHTFPAFCYLDRSGNCIPLTYSVFVPQFRKWLYQIGVTDINTFCDIRFSVQCRSNVDFRVIGPQNVHLQYIKLTLQDKLAMTSSMEKSISANFV